MNKYAYSLILSLAVLNRPIVNGSDYLSSDDEIEAPRVERAAIVAHGKKRLTEEQIEELKEAGAKKREERRLAREIMASHPQKPKVIAKHDDLVGNLHVQKEEVQIQVPISENKHKLKSDSDETLEAEAAATLVDKLLQKPQVKKKNPKYDVPTMKNMLADKALRKEKSRAIKKARDTKFASARYD